MPRWCAYLVGGCAVIALGACSLASASGADVDYESKLQAFIHSRGGSKRMLTEMGPEAIEIIAERLRVGAPAADRDAMVMTLWRACRLLPLPEKTKAKATEAFLVALRDPNEYVRSLAVNGVALAPPEVAARALVERLRDESEHIRIDSLSYLGGMGDARTKEEIRKFIAERSAGRSKPEIESDPSISFALRAISYIDARMSGTDLGMSADAKLKLLLRDRGENQELLQELGSEALLHTAYSLLEEIDLGDRVAVVWTLARQMMTLELPDGYKAMGVDALRKATRDPSADVRTEAVAALVKAAPESAIGALVDRLHDEDKGLRLQCLRYLAVIGDAGARSDIRQMIDDQSAGRTRQQIANDELIQQGRKAVSAIESRISPRSSNE